MFESYYGFARPPFSKDISPSEFFIHDSHEEVLARLGYCVKERSIAVLTGEVGSGKTVALRALVSELDESRNTVVYFFCLADLKGFYLTLIEALGGGPSFFRAQLASQAKTLIANETEHKKKNLVIIIDEAHQASIELLEELRLLSNDSMDSRSPFALILAGQPTLRRKLHLTTLNALSQRVALRCSLGGLSLEETAGYIRHHLSRSGRSDSLFSDDAIALIHRSSNGMPRRINNICTQALIAGFLDKKNIVDETTAKRAAAELEAD